MVYSCSWFVSGMYTDVLQTASDFSQKQELLDLFSSVLYECVTQETPEMLPAYIAMDQVWFRNLFHFWRDVFWTGRKGSQCSSFYFSAFRNLENEALSKLKALCLSKKLSIFMTAVPSALPYSRVPIHLLVWPLTSLLRASPWRRQCKWAVSEQPVPAAGSHVHTCELKPARGSRTSL